MTTRVFVGIVQWIPTASFREFAERPKAEAVEFFWEVVGEKLGIRR